MRVNLLLDHGPALAIIQAETLSGEHFAERRLSIAGHGGLRRLLRDAVVRTIEFDPYLGMVRGIMPGSRRIVAEYRRRPFYYVQ